MRNWLTLSVLTTVLLSLAITVVVDAYRTAITTPRPEIPARFVPGNSLPDSIYCDWQIATGDTQYCTAMPETSEHVSFDVNRQTGLITRTTMSKHGLTIGSLLLLWGTPTGYTKSGIAMQVYWQTRSAYITTTSLTPRSPILFITYNLVRPRQMPWRGLTNAR